MAEPVPADNHTKATATVALLAAIILGIAAVLTAWSSYREALTSDEVLKGYSEQQAKIAEANDVFSQADQESGIERQFFVSYAIAAAEKNSGALVALQATMTKELFSAIDWWVEQPDETSPQTPFVEENPNFASLPSQQLIAEADALIAEADTKRAAAEEADTVSDRFGLANVFFAVVLFLAGIATLLQRRGIQLGILVLSIAMLLGGVLILVTTPGWSNLT